MKNENLYTMEQPELGKKIQELRKSKGLTQEELVEKCNINVRTIQRIEAGDVTPRSFTVKTILEALGVEANLFFERSIHEEEVIQFSEKEKSTLNISWVAGIFLIISSIVGMIIEITLMSQNGGFEGGFIPRVAWNVPFLISLIFFLRGYHVVGKKAQNNVLTSGVIVYVISEILISIISISLAVFEFNDHFVETMSGVIIFLLYGISELIVGAGIVRLKNQFGSIGQAIGISKMILGIMLVTILLAPIAGILAIPVLILEVVFMYMIRQRIDD